ncbi:hypothetical protein [Pseudomonas sp. NPDC090592]|uniref:hypothetical protein n=1 Tax=Pseudomonas sp. NPDC090592 TaxID=3364480 RepID=UPI00383AE950
MAKQVINLGTAPAGAGGDDRRSAWLKAIANFDELYNFIATAFNRANILGAVGQSAGVPTGAIIQRGSNANGEYVRYADGTQICWASRSSASAAAGGYADVSFTLPIAFASSVYTATCQATPVNHWDYYGCLGVWTQTATGVTFRVRNGAAGAQSFACGMLAIGRWY